MLKSKKMMFRLAGMAIVMGFSACKKGPMHPVGPKPVDSMALYLKSLNDYKKSEHQLMAAYFRTWRDKATDPVANKTSMKELPDSLDIALVFPDYTPADNAFWDSLKVVYVPHLHSRGTKVVMSKGISNLINPDYANNEEGYIALAKKIFEENVQAYSLDGLDLDVERSFNPEELERVEGVMKALSKYLGPKSGSDKLLIYDTNQGGNTNLFSVAYSLVDYAIVQSYGRSINTLQDTFDSYANKIKPSQYLIGFSFYEERGTYWGDVTNPLQNSRAYSYAKWQPSQGTKGGIFSYAVDRDGVPQGQNDIVPTTYSVTRELISVMNPTSR
ncbi:Putative glycoside hydrolase Family 18, chitinase_18 [bacterium A37T11]|nr:Putative glycoside hydrolase Family 18, chitinase_18 [bacterium A37T11]